MIAASAAYCLHCGYPLRGLPSFRCPECGSAFDPRDPRTYGDSPSTHARRGLVRKLKQAILSPWLIVPAMWVSLQFPFIGSLAVIFGVAALTTSLYRKRWLASAALVLGSPIVGYLALGAFDYWRGEGRLRFYGLGGTESQNVDRRFRCERVSTGCMISGNEYVTDDVYNFALRSLIAVFGPMRGAYVGPYPTREEALASLENWQPIPPTSLMSDRIPLCDREVRLDDNVGIAMLDPRGYWVRARDDPDVLAEIVREIGPIQAVLHDGVLILRIPFFGSDRTQKSAMIALIDPQHGRPFAFYATGDYMHRFPPVRWRP